MSLPERFAIPSRLIVASLVAGMLAVSGCTVRPLYSQAPTETGAIPREELASIAIKPVDTRPAQEVRNQLIFLFNGGAGQPAAPRYTMTLTVLEQIEKNLVIERAGENDETAGTITLTGIYVLTDTATGKPVLRGQRSIASQYDIRRQAYAETRAARDAENRAARELAELLRLAIGQDLARRA